MTRDTGLTPDPESALDVLAFVLCPAHAFAPAGSTRELQAVRDMLHREAARVQREIVQYSTLTQAALQSTKTIAESLEQWRTAPDLRTVPD